MKTRSKFSEHEMAQAFSVQGIFDAITAILGAFRSFDGGIQKLELIIFQETESNSQLASPSFCHPSPGHHQSAFSLT